MSNNYEEKYRKAMEHIKIREEFEENLTKKLNKLENKRRVIIMKPIYRQKKYYAILSTCVALLVLGIFYLKRPEKEFNLKHSTGNITVAYTDDAQNIGINAKLAELTEDQIFNGSNTDIFRGIVKDIKNISINMGTDLTNYKAIATIQINKVLRGDIKQGEEIKILLSCPIGSDPVLEDTGVISTMRTGMEGIFMPVKYNDKDTWTTGDATLYYEDICNYGFLDGERYAFLETEEGLKYADWAFPSLKNPTSLDDVEAYILQKTGK